MHNVSHRDTVSRGAYSMAPAKLGLKIDQKSTFFGCESRAVRESRT